MNYRHVLIKNVSFALIVFVLLLSLPFSSISASASETYTSGNYTYTLTNNKATITHCSSSVNGEVSVPSSLDGYIVTGIGYSAFQYCSAITSIIIPDTVKNIEGDAFKYCYSLVSIKLPKEIENISGTAFYETGYVKDSSNWENGVLYIDDYCILADSSALSGSYTIKSGTKIIAGSAFYECKLLTSIVIPDSVKRIGNSAFYQCRSLNTVKIGKGIEYIGDCAFLSCQSLQDVYIYNLYGWCNVVADGIEASPLSALGVDIKNVYLNDKLIVDLVIPDGIKEIKYCAFYKIPSLKSLVIPDSVEKISNYAFRYCTIEKLSLGKGIKYIGDSAFERSGYLKHVCYNGTKEQWKDVNIGLYNYADLTSNISHYNADESIYELKKTAPTCTQKGSLSYSCNLCDYEYVLASVNAKGHSVVALNNFAPTCVSQGYTHYICLSCDYEYDSDFISKLEHKKGECVRNVDATCTQSGYSIYMCTECETEFNTDYTDKAMHFYVNKATGKVGCKDCSATLESSHNYSNNSYKTWEVDIPDAVNISIKFSSKTKTESGCDFIRIYDQTGNQLGEYSGTSLASKTLKVDGSYLKIVLDTDYSEKFYGFDVIKIDATFNSTALVNLRKSLINIENQNYSDINLDGQTDILDLIRLKRQIAETV